MEVLVRAVAWTIGGPVRHTLWLGRGMRRGMSCRVLVLALMVVNGADAARAARQRVARSVVCSLPSARHVVYAAPRAVAGVWHLGRDKPARKHHERG